MKFSSLMSSRWEEVADGATDDDVGSTVAVKTVLVFVFVTHREGAQA